MTRTGRKADYKRGAFCRCYPTAPCSHGRANSQGIWGMAPCVRMPHGAGDHALPPCSPPFCPVFCSVFLTPSPLLALVCCPLHAWRLRFAPSEDHLLALIRCPRRLLTLAICLSAPLHARLLADASFYPSFTQACKQSCYGQRKQPRVRLQIRMRDGSLLPVFFAIFSLFFRLLCKHLPFLLDCAFAGIHARRGQPARPKPCLRRHPKINGCCRLIVPCLG